MLRASQAQIVHFVLEKNFLTTVTTANIVTLVKFLVGLPDAFSQTPSLSTFARLADFGPGDLVAELSQTRRLISSMLMRNVDHIVASDDYTTLYAATTRQRHQAFNSEFRLWGLAKGEVDALATAILEAMGNEPASIKAIEARLPQNRVRELTQISRGGRVTKSSNVASVLRWLLSRGELCLIPAGQDPIRGWRIECLTYATLPVGYPELDLSTAPAEAEAQANLARAYLAAFGPATEADVTFWTGFGKSETARALNALSRETTLVMIAGLPGAMLMLTDQAETLRAIVPPKIPIVNVLPANDPYIVAHHASRARYFSNQTWQRQVFSSAGEAKPTIVLNGQIVGLWRWPTATEHDRDVIRWRLLTKVDGARLALIQTELERVAAFIGADAVVEQDGN